MIKLNGGHFHNSVCGFFRLEAAKIVDGKEISRRVLADWFPNLITNGGLDRMATNEDFLSYCTVGSDNTAPQYTDTSIGTFVQRTYNLHDTQWTTNSVSPYYRWVKYTYRFVEGTATGNLSEVGIGWSAGGLYPLFSHALILDTFSNPTTITVLADETLDVLYEYRVYPKETDNIGSITFTGNIGGTYNWIVRLANATIGPIRDPGLPPATNAMSRVSWWSSYYNSTSNQPIAAKTTQPSGMISTGSPSIYSIPYVAGNYWLTLTFPNTLDRSNYVNGLRTALMGFGPVYLQIQFTDPLTGKGVPKKFTDIFNFNIKCSWGRV
jgi:hypothetical protein